MSREDSKTFDSGLIKWKACFPIRTGLLLGRLLPIKPCGREFCLFEAVGLDRSSMSCALMPFWVEEFQLSASWI